jgi:hypothetical protein
MGRIAELLPPRQRGIYAADVRPTAGALDVIDARTAEADA